MERSNINLHSDILNNPEFFWDEGSLYEDIYIQSISFLELGRRVDLLNNRLDVLQELFEMINGQLHRRQIGRLDWIIIILLFMGLVVLIGYDLLLKDVGGFLRKPLF